MSARRRGCLEYSVARAKRTSFFTIWSCDVAPLLSASESPSECVGSSASESSEGGDSLRRRRVGGGGGDGSACYLVSFSGLRGIMKGMAAHCTAFSYDCRHLLVTACLFSLLVGPTAS